MLKKTAKKSATDKVSGPDKKGKEDFSYPAKDDIYSKSKEEQDVDPEDVSSLKSVNTVDAKTDKGSEDFEADIPGKIKKKKAGKKRNEKDFNDDVAGDDLDFQRTDFAPSDKNSAEEDEENDYYSLGGDDHDDLDEDRGE